MVLTIDVTMTNNAATQLTTYPHRPIWKGVDEVRCWSSTLLPLTSNVIMGNAYETLSRMVHEAMYAPKATVGPR